MPIRWLRSPAILMTAYVGLYVYAGPFVTIGSTRGRRSAVEIIIAVVLAVLAVRGSRAARVLMITYSLFGVLAMLSPSTLSSAGVVARLEVFICCVVQVLLLVSTPMYQRTRPGSSQDERWATPFLLAPRIWMVLASVAGGLVITVLPLVGWYGLRDSPCWPGHPAAHWGPCMALGYGRPFAYRFRGGIMQFREDSTHWLFVAAPQGIHPAAFAADWAMWSISALLALYLVSLSRRRDFGIAGGWSAASPPAPAVP
jgi:hypothetical protein